VRTRALVLYPQYGLANRLQTLASGKILADYTGRKLFVNWVPNRELCNAEWEDIFSNEVEAYPLPVSRFRAGVDLYDGTGIKIYDDGSTDNDFYWDMPQAVSCNKSDVVAVKSWQNFQPRGITTEAYRAAKSFFYRSLEPVETVRNTVNNIHERYFEGHEVVGVHIRMTDHLYWAKKDPALISPTDLFIDRMERILETSPGTRFFLATDDKKAENRIMRLFQGSVIVYEKEAYHDEAAARDTKWGVQEALVDWLLLSKTSRIIGSYASSFSREAGMVHLIKTDFILKREELSKPHYKRTMEFYEKQAKEHFRKYIKRPFKSRARKLFDHFAKAPLSRYLAALYRVLRKEGLGKFILYSYSYRRGQLSGWIKKRILKPR
jgi:hypothetical protein